MADLHAAIVRILSPNGAVLGVGFVASASGLIVTCSHVIQTEAEQNRNLSRPTKVPFTFLGTNTSGEAEVVASWWRGCDSDDIAILRYRSALPAGVQPLALGVSRCSHGHAFKTIGFPAAQAEGGLHATGTVLGETIDQSIRVLQLKSTEATLGFSGAPVLDEQTGSVIGVFAAVSRPDRMGQLQGTSFLIPSETLQAICPDLTFKSSLRSKWYCLPFWSRALAVLGLLALLLVAFAIPAQLFLNQPRPTFDFEGGSVAGWDVRYESDCKLGTAVHLENGRAHSGQNALAFDFQLPGPDYCQASPNGLTLPDKAQVKYEVPGLFLYQELSTWVYVPDQAPTDLVASCFILEHHTDGIGPKPEWPWFQTAYTSLVPGQWSQLRCLESDFKSLNYTGRDWVPLLVGFEFKRATGGAYSGVVYLDDVILR